MTVVVPILMYDKSKLSSLKTAVIQGIALSIAFYPTCPILEPRPDEADLLENVVDWIDQQRRLSTFRALEEGMHYDGYTYPIIRDGEPTRNLPLFQPLIDWLQRKPNNLFVTLHDSGMESRIFSEGDLCLNLCQKPLKQGERWITDQILRWRGGLHSPPTLRPTFLVFASQS